MTGQRVLVTGAAGAIGRMLRTRLARPDRVLRLLDVVRQDDVPEGAEVVTASVTDRYAMRAACHGMDAVIHLAGVPTEVAWPEVLATNIDGTQCVLEAARLEGVPRVVLASSNHAAGFHTRDAGGAELPADASGRPDTYYGTSKVAMEALGALYHDRFDMQVICLRIGSCKQRPTSIRQLATWLSPDDMGALAGAALDAPEPGYTIVWGVSRNTRRWWSLDAGEAIGYRPRDDAERYATEVIAAHGEGDPDDPELRHVGGGYCTRRLGGEVATGDPMIDAQEVAADLARS